MKWWDRLFGSQANKRNRDGYPEGYYAVPKERGVKFPDQFDPALKQFPNAFRKGEPTFENPADAVAWEDIRQRVMHAILRTIANSQLRDQLIVRGSVTMQHWFGKLARKPHDIDWLLQPDIVSAQAQEILCQVPDLLEQECQIYNVNLEVANTKSDDIWTYDRAPGKRLVIPWTSKGFPTGYIQMDFVFEEELWRPTVDMTIPGFAEGSSLLAASPEQSLAWKILWLWSDMYPSGKDLYDAVLLAESFPIDHQLIMQAYTDNGRMVAQNITAQTPMQLNIEWEEFHLEYPKVEGTAVDWQQRLCTALAPAFAKQ